MDISRFYEVDELRFTIEFVTPTFLGGADGNAEIRTAPFKNLIRRWWRIVNGNLSPVELWEKESHLFGSTEKGFGASNIRLQLDNSKSKVDISDASIFPKSSQGMNLASYIGYGPVTNRSVKKYIKPSSKISFVLAIPKNEREDFIQVLSFIHHFGTIGSRSRNGWGSLAIHSDSSFQLYSLDRVYSLAKDWKNGFLETKPKKYPSYLGKDEKGVLCWQTQQRATWKDSLQDLAENYKDLRSSIRFGQRFILGYPVTKHLIREWNRLPSQLVLKVIKPSANQFVGIFLHIPNSIPLNWDLANSALSEIQAWQNIHSVLDSMRTLSRFGGVK